METSKLAVIAALSLAGCAGSASGGDSSNTGTRANAAVPGFAPSTGAAGTNGMPPPVMEPGAFGNPGAMNVVPRMKVDGAAGDGCVDGMRCAAKGPDGDCGSLTLKAKVETIEHPGNVLLVFDTSASMNEKWNGPSRWEQAGTAIKNALMPLQDMLTIGTVFFPRADPNAPAVCVDPTGITCIFVPGLVLPSGSCGVTPITSADQINFAPGPQFLTTFNTMNNGAPPYAPVPGGFTPLKEGLMQAQAAIAGGMLTGLTSVVVITDGDPNCEWDEGVARQIVTDWHTNGINTYVVGLPGTTGAGDSVLNALAMAGGTGAFITPTDSAALEAKLREIATETVMSGFDSCEIEIDPPAEAPEKLHLIVTEGGMPQDVLKDLAEDYRWEISADGSKVTLQDRLCDDATGGRFEAIRFEFGCVDIPPLPKPPPVM